jgi:ketosteroid isomerase-like protein
MLLIAAVQSAAATVQIPAQPELTRAIAARDAELFALAFEGCDAKRLRAMLTDDLEFYHDKGGLTYRSGDEMADDYAKRCEERKKDNAYRSRRELVPSSLHVDPVPGHGAIETGEHLFYERQGRGPEKLVGRARFAHVWRLEGGTWKISRVLSFNHGPASEKK